MAETIKTIGRRMVRKKAAMVKAKAAAEKAEKDYRDEERAFWDRLDEEGDSTRTVDLGEDIGRVQFIKRETIRGRVIDKDRALASLAEAGLDEALVDRSVRQGVLNDCMRRWIRSGENIPEGLDFGATRYVTITPKKAD